MMIGVIVPWDGNEKVTGEVGWETYFVLLERHKRFVMIPKFHVSQFEE
jgi:hypothetical protein